MLLSGLTRDEQMLFLELCDLFSKIDNEVAESEMILIGEYRYEMDLSEQEYEIKGMGFDEVIANLKEISNKPNILKVLFELTALVMADDVFAPEEEELLKKFVSHFDINYEKVNEIKEVLKELKVVYTKIEDIISE